MNESFILTFLHFGKRNAQRHPWSVRYNMLVLRVSCFYSITWKICSVNAPLKHVRTQRPITNHWTTKFVLKQSVYNICTYHDLNPSPRLYHCTVGASSYFPFLIRSKLNLMLFHEWTRRIHIALFVRRTAQAQPCKQRVIEWSTKTGPFPAQIRDTFSALWGSNFFVTLDQLASFFRLTSKQTTPSSHANPNFVCLRANSMTRKKNTTTRTPAIFFFFSLSSSK